MYMVLYIIRDFIIKNYDRSKYIFYNNTHFGGISMG